MFLEKMEDEIPNGWDEHFCFNIIDFTTGSAIIVNKDGKRERGIVVDADYKRFFISYKNVRGGTSTVHINGVVLLQDGSRDWLSKPL